MAFDDEFKDIRFFDFLSYGARIKIKYKTSVIRLRKGQEERVAIWKDAQREYNITPALRDQADLDDVLDFFQQVQGPRYIFRFLDPLDFDLTGSTTIDGQLYKSYASGVAGDGYSTMRPIFFDNGDNTFDVPVRFAEMKMATSVEVYQRFEWQVRLVEARFPISGSGGADVAPPDFVPALLPHNATERSSYGPQWDVISVDADSGALLRLPQFTQSVLSANVLQEVRTPLQMLEFLNFFHARRGRLTGFLVRNELTGGSETVRFGSDEVEVSIDGYEVRNWAPVPLVGYDRTTDWQPEAGAPDVRGSGLAPDCAEPGPVMVSTGPVRGVFLV